MLKLPDVVHPSACFAQPPSGGCVLKLLKCTLSNTTKPPAAFGRLCVETKSRKDCWWYASPAAFGRLCVETIWLLCEHLRPFQPPSGGCVLKPERPEDQSSAPNQPPSGGCVLKRLQKSVAKKNLPQPPSGGCVLKQDGI